MPGSNPIESGSGNSQAEDAHGRSNRAVSLDRQLRERPGLHAPVRGVERQAHPAHPRQAPRCRLAQGGPRRSGHHASRTQPRTDSQHRLLAGPRRRFDRIIALDEFDLETAAQIREHMRIPGMGTTTSAYYRDKLAMRMGALQAGFLVPEFCRVLNYDELRATWTASPRPGCSSRAPRPQPSGSAKSTSPISSGAPSMSWVTARATSCSSSLCPATFTTSTPSSTRARCSFPSSTNTAARPCR